MTTPDEPTGPNTQIQIPDDLVEGTYADFVSVWHSRDVFVLDFAVLAQPVLSNQIMSRVVSRVRIPPTQVFEIMKALEQQLTAWESERAAEAAQQQPPGD